MTNRGMGGSWVTRIGGSSLQSTPRRPGIAWAGGPGELRFSLAWDNPCIAPVALVIAGLLLLPAVGAAAGEAGSDQTPREPSVQLDRLLKLPDSFAAEGSEVRGGVTRVEWLRRFEEAKASIDEAEAELKQAEQELDEMAGGSSSWNVAPPGATDPQSGPLSFRLREEIRRRREAKERAEKALRALHVKADLAGVPASWRQPRVGPDSQGNAGPSAR